MLIAGSYLAHEPITFDASFVHLAINYDQNRKYRRNRSIYHSSSQKCIYFNTKRNFQSSSWKHIFPVTYWHLKTKYKMRIICIWHGIWHNYDHLAFTVKYHLLFTKKGVLVPSTCMSNLQNCSDLINISLKIADSWLEVEILYHTIQVGSTIL